MIREKIRGVLIGFAGAFFVLGNALPAYADTLITNVKLTFQNQYEEDGGKLLEPVVGTDSTEFKIADVSWSQKSSDWSPGQAVTASIVLKPDSSGYFSGIYADERIDISGAEYRSCRREDDGSLLVKAVYYPVLKLGKTESAGWSGDTRASWKTVPYATAYQLRLYKKDGTYVTTLTLGGTSVELSDYMTGGGEYYYEVRAIAGNSENSSYKRNGEYVTSRKTETAVSKPARGVWTKNGSSWHYTDENGNAAVSGWRYIGGVWYYFDGQGRALSGWQQINGSWYYMDGECRMQTGWMEMDGKMYYLDSAGVMITGWYQMSPGKWYYFYDDGSMAVNTSIDGYRIGPDGKMKQ